MKEKELREIADCKLCKKPFGHTNLPLFFRVSVQTFGVDMEAVRRQDGLGALLGSNQLAAVMGTDAEMAKPINSLVTSTVCHNCYIDNLVLAQLQDEDTE